MSWLAFMLIALVVSCKSSEGLMGKKDRDKQEYHRKRSKYKSASVKRDPSDSAHYVSAAPEPISDSDGEGVSDTTVWEHVEVGSAMENVKSEHVILKSSAGKAYTIKDEEGVDHAVKDATKPDSVKGTMAYNIPDDMTVGKNYEVKVRITKDKAGKQQLIVGDEGAQPIATVGEKSTITIESIRVESVMSAELVSLDQAFEITTSSTKEQNIEKLGYTEWAWNIKPTKSGEHPLKLLIKVRIVNEQGGYYKDIVVFERNIKAKANFSYSASVWFGKYWQWLCTTIVIPIFLWWRKRKKERDGKEAEGS